MSPPKRQDDAISLSSDSSPDQSPIISPKVMPSTTSRMSVNNYGQPVRGPDLSRPLTLPFNEPIDSDRNEIDLTQDDEDENGDMDEELRRAIALSLQSHEEEQKRGNQEVPKQDPIELEKTPTANSSKTDNTADKSSRTISPVATATSDRPLGFLGLDRKAMEAERLARLKRKREAADSSPQNTAQAKSSTGRGQPASSTDNATTEAHSKRPRTADKPAADTNTRTKPITPPPVTRPSAPTSASTKPPTSKPSLGANSAPKSSPSNSTSSTLYPRGAILKTPSPTHPSSPSTPTISFPQLIGPTPSTLTSALLSSFTIDFDWLLPHFSTSTTNFVFVLHTHSEPHRAELSNSFSGVENVRLVFPGAVGGMKGTGTMHGKLMVLFYRGSETEKEGDDGRFRHGRCRVVVPTGNLVGHDWGVGGVMENLVFVLDLPVVPSETTQDKLKGAATARKKTPLERGLRAYLTAQGVPASVLRKLDGVDFEGTEELAFVSSVAGFHFEGGDGKNDLFGAADEEVEGKGRERFDGAGLWCLSAAVRELGLAARREVLVDYATSSLGSLGNDYLAALYDAVKGGDDGAGRSTTTAGTNGKKKVVVKMPTTASSSSTSSSATNITTTAAQSWRDKLRIYFPSATTVAASLGGPNAAGTICFHDKWWDRPDFPREVVRDAVSVREGLLGHYKLLLVRFEDDAKGNGSGRGGGPTAAPGGIVDGGEGKGPGGRSGWAYVGSANCSESAWGRVVADRSTKTNQANAKKLTVRNWECGVVVPLTTTITTATVATGVGHRAAADGAGKDGDGEAFTATALASATGSSSQQPTLEALGRDLPVPMQVPSESLVATGKRPWFFGGFSGSSGGGE